MLMGHNQDEFLDDSTWNIFLFTLGMSCNELNEDNEKKGTCTKSTPLQKLNRALPNLPLCNRN
ncbi:hypothetical protein A0J61_01297 [Choanephora cucurbitarum]|uniref:Uncharacterized protein n=1 Tax=Choanephora cucurbitarum TaxID=101091 RepID=A0A1C7NT38_9FUNG|nr:hypothetical protein A0J61_01297 [Choanephora cucurbitarum]